LHQRVKYINEGQLITIKEGEEMMVSKSSIVPYIEVAKEESTTPLLSFEIDGNQNSSGEVHIEGIWIMEKNTPFCLG